MNKIKKTQKDIIKEINEKGFSNISEFTNKTILKLLKNNLENNIIFEKFISLQSKEFKEAILNKKFILTFEDKIITAYKTFEDFYSQNIPFPDENEKAKRISEYNELLKIIEDKKSLTKIGKELFEIYNRFKPEDQKINEEKFSEIIVCYEDELKKEFQEILKSIKDPKEEEIISLFLTYVNN